VNGKNSYVSNVKNCTVNDKFGSANDKNCSFDYDNSGDNSGKGDGGDD